MKTAEVAKLYDQYILPTYARVGLCIVKGKGSKVWDAEGKEYLDFFPGWAVSGLGHCHPSIVSAIKNQAKKLIHIPNSFYGIKQAELAREIVTHSFDGRVFFCNSGAEAVESAIKFARKFGHDSGRYEIVTMRDSFHGRTLAAVAATGQEKYQKGFEPLPAGFKHVPINDWDALSQAVGPKTIAIMLEPIQGEGGIHVADPEYLRKIRKLCDEKNMLLIFDEVQTGLGRTGKWFAYQHYDVVPDLMTLAKSLGNGVPIGALVVSRKIKQEVLVAGTHASTYGGNPLVTAAAVAVFKTIEKEGLLQNTVAMGRYLEEKLLALKAKYKAIKEVRGKSLMVGVELDRPGADIIVKCRERGLLINCTQERVLRIMPAMTVTKRMIDKAIHILDQACAEVLK